MYVGDDENLARQLIEKTCPNPATLRAVVAILAETILEANTYGRDCWVVQADEKIRIIIAHYIVCEVWQRGVWLALDDQITKAPDYYPELGELNAWGWVQDKSTTPNSHPTYKDRLRQTDFSVNGYYTIGAGHAVAWPHIRRLFFDLIYKAVYYGRIIDPRSPGTHSTGILKYIRNELGIYIPDPLYE